MKNTPDIRFMTPLEETLQSIDKTLKRIELNLLLVSKTLSVSSDAQEIVERLLEESSVD